MHNLADVETAADALPTHEKRELVQFLVSRLQEEGVDAGGLFSPGHSLLDIEPVSIGAILQSFGHGDDLLGEMLESRR